jgi:hypothetical protein
MRGGSYCWVQRLELDLGAMVKSMEWAEGIDQFVEHLPSIREALDLIPELLLKKKEQAQSNGRRKEGLQQEDTTTLNSFPKPCPTCVLGKLCPLLLKTTNKTNKNCCP